MHRNGLSALGYGPYVSTVPAASESVATAGNNGATVASEPTSWGPVIGLGVIIVAFLAYVFVESFWPRRGEGVKGAAGAAGETLRPANIAANLRNVLLIAVTAAIGLAGIKLALANLIVDMDRSKRSWVLWLDSKVVKPMAAVFFLS